MSALFLTLVVPLFNRPKTLSRILDALEAQTLPAGRFEAVFVDDSGPESYPNQKAVLDARRTSYGRTLLTTGLPRNVNGVSVARNLAIRAAKGDVIVFMDDDCVPHPAMLKEHAAAHAAEPRLMAVGNRGSDESWLTKKLPLPPGTRKCAREAEASAQGTLGSGDFITSNASARKADLLKAGLFDESFAKAGEYGFEDRELGERLLRMGLTFRFLVDAFIWNAPKESDPWEGNRDAARSAAHDRFYRKHKPLKHIWARLRGKGPKRGGKPGET